MSKLKGWIQAIRAFSFPASAVPVLLGASLALGHPGPIAWKLLPVIALCALLMHAGTNVIGEYFDFIKGVDRADTLGSSRVLVDHILTPKEVLYEGCVLFFAAFLSGLFLVANRGLPMLILGITGILGGYFYSAPPIGYKYRGLGDPGVFILMGPLMVIGTHLAMTGSWDVRVAAASLPIGCLVTAILCANNLRDTESDRRAGYLTLESCLGFSGAKWLYTALAVSAYVIVAWMVAVRMLTPWSLLSFLSLPVLAGNLSALHGPGTREKIASLDIRTAKLHLIFGATLSLSLVLAGLRK